MATRFKIWTICLCTICTGATQAVEPGNSTWKLDNWSPSSSKSIKPNFSLTTTTQVELSHRLDFHWYLARVRGETGLVPAAYLEIIARCAIPLHPEKHTDRPLQPQQRSFARDSCHSETPTVASWRRNLVSCWRRSLVSCCSWSSPPQLSQPKRCRGPRTLRLTGMSSCHTTLIVINQSILFLSQSVRLE